MGHLEERLERDLGKISNSLLSIGIQVKNAVEYAVKSLLTGNKKLAYDTVIGDHKINRLVKEFDNSCLQFIAVHLPSAGHLRLISSAMRVSIELERIGDYASTICRESVQLSRNLAGGNIAKDFEVMSQSSLEVLTLSLEAFSQKDAEKSKNTISMTNDSIRSFDKFFESLLGNNEDWNQRDLFTFLIIFYMLRRVSDQAKNICKEAIFSELGDTKSPRIYPILFLDENNNYLGPLAAAIAKKKYGHCGTYDTLGSKACEALDPTLIEFASEHGIDLKDAGPKVLDENTGWSDYYIVICLQGNAKSYMKYVPFHTIALEWEIGKPPETSDDKLNAKEIFENIYRNLSVQLEDLLERLCGDKIITSEG